jgi:transposase, IS5 family
MTLLRWANLLQAATLHHLLDDVVVLARSLKVTRGRKRRIDGTGVKTNIYHPTDSTLLYDGVRVLSRTLVKATRVLQVIPALARPVLRDRTRSAKRQMKRIMETARQRGTEAADRMQTAYQYLLDITRTAVRQTHRLAQGSRPRQPRLAKNWRSFWTMSSHWSAR